MVYGFIIHTLEPNITSTTSSNNNNNGPATTYLSQFYSSEGNDQDYQKRQNSIISKVIKDYSFKIQCENFKPDEQLYPDWLNIYSNAPIAITTTIPITTTTTTTTTNTTNTTTNTTNTTNTTTTGTNTTPTTATSTATFPSTSNNLKAASPTSLTTSIDISVLDQTSQDQQILQQQEPPLHPSSSNQPPQIQSQQSQFIIQTQQQQQQQQQQLTTVLPVINAPSIAIVTTPITAIEIPQQTDQPPIQFRHQLPSQIPLQQQQQQPPTLPQQTTPQQPTPQQSQIQVQTSQQQTTTTTMIELIGSKEGIFRVLPKIKPSSLSLLTRNKNNNGGSSNNISTSNNNNNNNNNNSSSSSSSSSVSGSNNSNNDDSESILLNDPSYYITSPKYVIWRKLLGGVCFTMVCEEDENRLLVSNFLNMFGGIVNDHFKNTVLSKVSPQQDIFPKTDELLVLLNSYLPNGQLLFTSNQFSKHIKTTIVPNSV